MSRDCANVVVKNTFLTTDGEHRDDTIDALHRTISDSCVVYGSDGSHSETAISRATLMTMRATKPSAPQSHPMPRIAERPVASANNTYIDDIVVSRSEDAEDNGPPGVFKGPASSGDSQTSSKEKPNLSRSGSREKPRVSIVTNDGFDDSLPCREVRTSLQTNDGFDDLNDLRLAHGEDGRESRRTSLGSRATPKSNPTPKSTKSDGSRRASNMLRVTEDSVLEDNGPPGVFAAQISITTYDGDDDGRLRPTSVKSGVSLMTTMTDDGFEDSWPLSHYTLKSEASDDEEILEVRGVDEQQQVTGKTIGERFPDRRKWSSMISVGSEAVEEDEDGTSTWGSMKAQASLAAAAVTFAANGRRKSGRRNWGSVMTDDSVDDEPSSHSSGQARRSSGQRSVGMYADHTVASAPMPYLVPPMVPAQHPLPQPMPFYDPWYPWGSSASYVAPSYGMGNMDWMQMGRVNNAQQSQPSSKKKAGKGKRRKSLDGSAGSAAIAAGRHTRTTLMLKNLPSEYTRDHVVTLLNKEGFKGLFNFVYMPMCLQTMASFGYAFVNLVSFVVADQCWSRFQGFSKWDLSNSRTCEVCWSEVQQGLQGNVEHYRSSQIMHESVPELAKPAIYMNGSHVPFPPPTRRLSAPQLDRKHPTELR